MLVPAPACKMSNPLAAQVSLYNVKKNGKLDFLSIGEDMLPTVFMVRFTAACPLGSMCPSPSPF